MAKYFVLYNGLSDNGNGLENAKKLQEFYKGDELKYEDIISIKDLKKFLNDTKEQIILTGGDGTLNHFVNSVNEDDIPENLLYFAAGTGNDFYHDISELENTDKPILVKKYLINLPVATINGKDYKFFNGVGYGIDGYCCEEADRIKDKDPSAKINYTSIAVKGLLFKFKPSNGKVSVDNKTYEFKKIWLAPVMKGKYYGGGMIPCPSQNRNSDKLSVLVWSKGAKLPTLMNFSNIFKGTHIKKEKHCKILSGYDFVVEFDKPCAAQVDGETVLNVTKVEIKAHR